jgi:hypothetical protein
VTAVAVPVPPLARPTVNSTVSPGSASPSPSPWLAPTASSSTVSAPGASDTACGPTVTTPSHGFRLVPVTVSWYVPSTRPETGRNTRPSAPVRALTLMTPLRYSATSAPSTGLPPAVTRAGSALALSSSAAGAVTTRFVGMAVQMEVAGSPMRLFQVARS